MGAWDYLSTDQSYRYVDPEEHIQNLTHSNDQKYMNMSMDQMWERKEAESREPGASRRHGAGIYDSLMAGDPIREPISLVHDDALTTSPTQIDGHHRIAAAAAAQRNLGRQIRVPVEYMSPRRFGRAGDELSAARNMTQKHRGGQGMAVEDSLRTPPWNSQLPDAPSQMWGDSLWSSEQPSTDVWSSEGY